MQHIPGIDSMQELICAGAGGSDVLVLSSDYGRHICLLCWLLSNAILLPVRQSPQ